MLQLGYKLSLWSAAKLAMHIVCHTYAVGYNCYGRDGYKMFG